MNDYQARLDDFNADVAAYGYASALNMWEQKTYEIGSQWGPMVSVESLYNEGLQIRRKPSGYSGSYPVDAYTIDNPPTPGDVVWRGDLISPTPDTKKPYWARAVTIRYNPDDYPVHREMLANGWLMRDRQSALNWCFGAHEQLNS